MNALVLASESGDEEERKLSKWVVPEITERERDPCVEP
jgi:hypothetical protein